MHKQYYDLNKQNIFTTDIIATIVYLFAALALTSGGSLLYLVVWLVLFGCVCLIIFMHPDSCNAVCRDPKILCLIIVSAMMVFHGLYVAGPVYIAKQVVFSFQLYSPIIIFIHFRKPERREQLKFIVKCSFWLILFFCVFSLVFYTLFPGAARNSRDYISLIGGGYGLACAVTILSVFFFGLLVNGFFKYSKKVRNIVFISTLIMLLTVFRTESTLTFLIAVVGFISCFYFKNNNKNAFYARMLLIPFVIVMLVIFLPSLGRWLISISSERMGETRMFERLHSVGNLFAYGIDNSDAEYTVNRFLIPFITFGTFFKNPVFGVAYKHGCGYYRPYNYGVGNHCEFADALANYGIVGGIPFLMMYLLQVREILKFKIPHPSKAWILVLVLLGLFNPLRYFQVNFVLFFFIPAFSLLYEDFFADNDKKQKEEQAK